MEIRKPERTSRPGFSYDHLSKLSSKFALQTGKNTRKTRYYNPPPALLVGIHKVVILPLRIITTRMRLSKIFLRVRSGSCSPSLPIILSIK